MNEAPSAAELAAVPQVRDEIEKAWTDSDASDPLLRHEEGGWIYLELASGSIFVVRAAAGVQAAIDLSNPPLRAGSIVVGKFHTHPNPTAAGWYGGPSRQDRYVDAIHGVPDLIRADNGLYYSGPDRRRGGTSGSPGYPS